MTPTTPVTPMNEDEGRSCPLAYRYGAAALATSPTVAADTLYVVGGLYGNLPALERVLAMAQAETTPVTLVFNGDFNWFNADDDSFRRINDTVLQHDAILGNVEFELGSPDSASGCGCAYPSAVDQATVDRSNRIHSRLKAVAQRHPDILERLAALPMFARYAVGGVTVGVVHGDGESLAGWCFDASEIDQPERQHQITDMFRQAQVDIFASTHTCVPLLRRFGWAAGSQGLVVNNGAAGMPNFQDAPGGLLTRISTRPSPHTPRYGAMLAGVFIDSLPIAYDAPQFSESFLANWPPGSDAHLSYFARIEHGPDYQLAAATRHAGATWG